jgi:hypothetical protein
MTVDQRSWVGPKGFVVLNPPVEANKPIEIGMEYSNFGKTPAIDVTGYADPAFVISEAKLDFSRWFEPLTLNHSVLFPGSVNHIVRTVPKDLPGYPATAPNPGIPEPVFSDLVAEKSFIYLYGTLDYTDIFGFQHWTHFCVRYSFPYKGFVYCDMFNKVDPEKR